MALLLALLMLTHWLAAITLVPSIFSIVRPSFVARDIEPLEALDAQQEPGKGTVRVA
jgi:hypothetical protein